MSENENDFNVREVVRELARSKRIAPAPADEQRRQVLDLQRRFLLWQEHIDKRLEAFGQVLDQLRAELAELAGAVGEHLATAEAQKTAAAAAAGRGSHAGRKDHRPA